MIIKTTTQQKRGAVLLIAILVSSVALAVGMGVYNRTYKELLFASFWKQTQVAFSAADGGLECALYWDLKGVGGPECFGSPISGWTPGNTGTFQADTITGSGCVKVEVSDIVPIPPATATRKISAKGYNASCAVVNDVSNPNPRLVERGLEVTY